MSSGAIFREVRPLPAELLGLAAAPTFAAMALLTAFQGGGPADLLCMAPAATLPVPGMAAMYALMAVFHSAPWLRRLMAARQHAPLTPKGDPR